MVYIEMLQVVLTKNFVFLLQGYLTAGQKKL